MTAARAATLFERCLRLLVSKPTMGENQGRPTASFNKMQCYAWPEDCKAQMDIAMSHCPLESELRQRRLLNLMLRPIF